MSMMPFPDLNALATHFRAELANKKFILLYAYNGTGKTRLSTAFKDIGKQAGQADTLYFNAFTEDLFSWDNDLENDRERVLNINKNSRFFDGLGELEMDNRIRPLLSRYADFDFRIDTDEWFVSFSRRVKKVPSGEDAKYETENDIKVSRGEENIFLWCFFLAIVQLAMDDDGTGPYAWVKYVYIDDPISSLDEHNAIAVASHLAQLLKREDSRLKSIISTHHTLFFNVLCNELSNATPCFLSLDKQLGGYVIRKTSKTPFFHHVATLVSLYEAEQSDQLYTYHFNMLRSILEKTASFHGYPSFSACIRRAADDEDGILHARLINILSHGNYSLYEPQEMLDENKSYFRKILHDFLNRYPFNPALFPPASTSPPIPATTPVATS